MEEEHNFPDNEEFFDEIIDDLELDD